MSADHRIQIPAPDLQSDFSDALSSIRTLMLQDALGTTVAELEITKIDKELAKLAPSNSLSALAKKGLRGELLFAVPCIFERNPRLLGYYRLLLGFSQKAFYTREFGVARFKVMEEKGSLSDANTALLPPLCRGLNQSADILFKNIGPERISRELLDDLTLLTLGPQLRGGANVKRGAAAIDKVFKVIQKIAKKQILSVTQKRMTLRNAAGREVFIEFASDPDITIREKMEEGKFRNIIAIEIKGGKDYSNIHNRLGEAEKSHQKARRNGYVECWTVINVVGLETKTAYRESPSTNKFYAIEQITSETTDEYMDFRNRIVSLTGIPSHQK